MFAAKTKYSAKSQRAIAITNSITNFLIQDMRPFRTVDTAWFHKMLQTLDPKYTIPSRKQFSTVSIPQKYEAVKQVVKTELRKAQQVPKLKRCSLLFLHTHLHTRPPSHLY